MADDAQSFFQPAAESVSGPAVTPRQVQVRTLIDSTSAYDADVLGMDVMEPCEGGLLVTYDGRYSVPSVVLNGPDGTVEITGLSALQALSNAFLKAESWARAHRKEVA